LFKLGNFSAYWRRMEPHECPYRAAALFTVGISSHHTNTWKSSLYNECGVMADKNKWMEINMKFLNCLFWILDGWLAT
jgi:hypothetical protein